MSENLLYVLGEADANMYLCSKDLRPSEQKTIIIVKSVPCFVNYILSDFSSYYVSFEFIDSLPLLQLYLFIKLIKIIILQFSAMDLDGVVFRSTDLRDTMTATRHYSQQTGVIWQMQNTAGK